MNQEEFLKARKQGIGASDSPIICGVSKWKSPIELFQEKLSPEISMEETEAMTWGKRLETLILSEFSERNNWDFGITYFGSGNPTIFHHPTKKFLICSPDALDSEKKVVIEIKTANSFYLNQIKAGTIPEPYLIQIQHQMGVLEFPTGFLVFLVGGQRYFQFEIQADLELQKMIFEKGEIFWECIQNKTPPLVDGSESCTKILNQIYCKSTGEIKEASDSEVQIGRELLALKEQKKELEVSISEKENQLKNWLKTSSLASSSEITFSWKEQIRKAFDLERFKIENPDIFKKYQKENSIRVFRIVENK